MTEPSGWEKFKYFTLGLTPPAETREWVERDINTTGWQVRRFFQNIIGICLGLALIGPIIRGMSWETWRGQLIPLMVGVVLAGLLVGVLQAMVLADYVRRRALAYYRRKWDR